VTDPTTAPAGVPAGAVKRLAELRPGTPGSIFTSDLSVAEFLLVKKAGFAPLGLVLGSSIYHVGMQVGRWSKNQELQTLSQAMYHARELAMGRMLAEADMLGADGIVGVRLTIEFKEFGPTSRSSSRWGPRSRPRGSGPRCRGATRGEGPSAATYRGRTSGRCCRPGTHRSDW